MNGHKLQQLQLAAQICVTECVHTWHEICRIEDIRALMARRIIRSKAESSIAGNNGRRLEYCAQMAPTEYPLDGKEEQRQ